MIRSMKILARLRLTIHWNTSVNSWRKVPIIRKFNLGVLIGNDDVTLVYNVFSAIWTGIKLLFTNLFYIGIFMFLIPMMLQESMGTSAWSNGLFAMPTATSLFVVSFLLLTLAGGIIRNHFLETSLDTWYMIYLLRMDAREYTISSHVLNMVKVFLGQAPFLLLFGWLADVPFGLCLLLPFVTLAVKQIAAAKKLVGGLRTKKILCTPGNKVKLLPTILNMVLNCVIVVGSSVLFVCQYALEATANETLYMPVIYGLLLAGGLCGFWIFTCKDYLSIYDALRSTGEFAEQDLSHVKLDATHESLELTKEDNLNEELARSDSSLAGSDSGMTGLQGSKMAYDSFHRIFMRRHKKLMTRSANRMAIVVLFLCALLVALRIILFITGEVFDEEFVVVCQAAMPYMALLLYWLNRGENMTNAMFMNCDHAMLAYNFYREPDTILAMFRRRLVSLIWVNLRPAGAIALLFLLAGLFGEGTISLTFLMYALTILLLSVFFSVHTLVMYYLLQPFDAESQSVGKLYKIVTFITYIVCYTIDDVIKDPMVFCIGAAAFSVLYIIIGLLLVKWFAPKTFRIR